MTTKKKLGIFLGLFYEKIMNDYKFKASITHTEKTVRDLYKTQYFCFDKTRIISRFIAGFILILITVTLKFSLALKGVFLLVGAWLVSTPDFPSQIRAEKNLAARKNPLPVMNYEFYDDKIKLSGEGTCDINYEKIKILLQDTKYFYLFISKNSACMIDKSTLTDLKGFMNFIEEKTKTQWHVQKSFFLFLNQIYKN